MRVGPLARWALSFGLLRSLALALAGGGAAYLLAMPSPWLTGPMIASAIAAILGVSAPLPRPLQWTGNLVIGLSFGSSLTRETLFGMASWPVTLALVLLASFAIHIACQFYYERLCRWDRASAYYASVPGVFIMILAMAAPSRADLRLVVIAHGMRLFLLLALLPLLILAWQGPLPAPPGLEGAGIVDLALLATVGGAFAFAFTRFRAPAAALLGGMAASGLLHVSGLAHGSMPSGLMLASLAVMGLMVGGRFAGTDLALLRRAGLAAGGGFVVALAICLIFIGLAVSISGLAPSQLTLAFAPGGLDTMLSLALILHLDAAFVAAHQLLRFVVVATLVPILARMLGLEQKMPRSSNPVGGA